MRLRHTLPAGILDAGLASLATLGIGVYAAHFLPTSVLGTYALFFSSFLFAAVIPTQLVIAPAEFTTIRASRTHRLSLLRQMWRLGLPTATIATVVATTVACLGARAPARVLWALAVTAIACSMISPFQDHVRRTLHLAGVSWRAALVSLVQLCTVVLSLGLFRLLRVGDAWHPLGALAIANLVSMSTGLWISRSETRAPALPRYRVAQLVRSGRWLLLLEATITGAMLASSVLITRLASADALGYAEAARIVAQPVFVLMVGMGMALGPRSVEAGAALDQAAARRIARPFAVILVTGALIYGTVTVTGWWGNPLSPFIPKAYVVDGLVPVSILGFLILGISSPYRSELVGAGREHLFPRIAIIAGALQCSIALGSRWLESFARPVGLIAFSVVLLLALWRDRQAMYREPKTQESEEASGTSSGH